MAAELEELPVKNKQLCRENAHFLDTVLCETGRSNNTPLMGPGSSPVCRKRHLSEHCPLSFRENEPIVCHTCTVKPSERHDNAPTGDKEHGECPMSNFVDVDIHEGGELAARVRGCVSGWSIAGGNSIFETNGRQCCVKLSFSR